MDWHKCFADRRVLVTGASGFIGAHLAASLNEHGATVVTLLADWDPESPFVRTGLIERVRTHVGGIEDYDLVERVIRSEQVDTVFHLAATATTGAAHASPLRAFEVNIRGTYNVLEACRANRQRVGRVVVASSDKAYGKAPRLPYTEDMPMAGRAPYDVSKSCADLIALSYHATYGTPVAVGRYGNTFGGGDLQWSRLIPGTIRRLVRSERPVVRAPSGREFTRDFLYVADSVESYFAMAAGLDSGVAAGEAFNFAMGVRRSPTQLVREIQRLMGREGIEPQIVSEQAGEISDQHISNEKAKHLLGWTPGWTLAGGLAETITWYRDYLGEQAASGVIELDAATLSGLTASAAASPRLRHHQRLSAPVDRHQRVLIGLQPGTYIRPHRHPNTPNCRGDETFVVLRGTVGILTLDGTGRIESVRRASRNEKLQMPGGVYHTVVCLEPNTVISASTDSSRHDPEKEWLTCFPPEGDASCSNLVEQWVRATRDQQLANSPAADPGLRTAFDITASRIEPANQRMGMTLEVRRAVPHCT